MLSTMDVISLKITQIVLDVFLNVYNDDGTGSKGKQLKVICVTIDYKQDTN